MNQWKSISMGKLCKLLVQYQELTFFPTKFSSSMIYSNVHFDGSYALLFSNCTCIQHPSICLQVWAFPRVIRSVERHQSYCVAIQCKSAVSNLIFQGFLAMIAHLTVQSFTRTLFTVLFCFFKHLSNA